LLAMVQGADFCGIAPFQRGQNGKDKVSVIGFASHEWLRRSMDVIHIVEDTMRREDLAVLVCQETKDLGSSLKLVPPSKVNINSEGDTNNSFQFNADMLKKLLGNMDLLSTDQDDLQLLNNKCMVMKILNN
jgi:hypothetical protein